MASQTKQTICCLCKYVPLSFFVFIFTIFVGYVVYNLHQFRPIPPKNHIDCDQFVTTSPNASVALSEYLENRTVAVPDEKFQAGKCWNIRRRRYFPIVLPSSIEFHHFLYFIRLVSKDYDFVEETLSMQFSPQHFYCLPIDTNSTAEFQEKMRNLGMCMINVIVPDQTFNGSDPLQVFTAHQTCFNILEKYKWKHAIILQEGDAPIQSIQYVGAYLYRLGSSSRIGTETITEDIVSQMKKNLNETENAKAQVKHALQEWWATRSEPIFLCHDFQKPLYSYILDTLKTTDFPPQKGDAVPDLNLTCSSEYYDSTGNCVLGMENYNYALESKKLFLRVDPQFDNGFVQCLGELTFRRMYKTVI